MNIIRTLKALSDETRLRIINLLWVENLCVCEIEAILQSSQSNVSRHLAKLRDSGIIYSEKKSQWVYYGMSIEAIKHYAFIKTLLDVDVAKYPQYQEDIAKLKSYREQNITCGSLEGSH
ncbi:metalloregulator ArsR/SmtB family transcription factor [Pelosinus sp. UFO1]|uniref:ArsR/SmtB family transcription factor n=1 Tax=Pelosinus sp. UFO1 TaxID=484770 RepID=UPI0004D17B15|nr:metalloregulator ArsR/SmtB family transcription factor [Pelosinus sp. UFO1]AIF50403.1 transcriptional regulator, ArsR family [Pelosinus sp. UFO1]